MAYFDFKRLIKKYTTSFTVIFPSGDGDWNDAGDWVESSTQTTMSGAIIAQSENKIYRSEGTLTMQDRALYMLEPLKFALDGAKVIHGGKEYSIENANENAEFTGVFAYTLKFVSVFNEGGE